LSAPRSSTSDASGTTSSTPMPRWPLMILMTFAATSAIFYGSIMSCGAGVRQRATDPDAGHFGRLEQAAGPRPAWPVVTPRVVTAVGCCVDAKLRPFAGAGGFGIGGIHEGVLFRMPLQPHLTDQLGELIDALHRGLDRFCGLVVAGERTPDLEGEAAHPVMV